MIQIDTVTVIGAGTAGRSIAQAAALAGFRVILVDILPASLRQAHSEMRDRLQLAQDHGKLSKADADRALGRLELAASLPDATRQADLVIEAVPDEMESKLEIFTLLDKIARPGTILACTSASLSLSDIASATYREASILGMRFGHSADGAGPDRLQIVCSPQTEQQAIEASAVVAQRMGVAVELIKQSANLSE